MTMNGFRLGIPPFVLLLAMSCATQAAHDTDLYDYIWSGVSLLDRQPDDRFTDAQVRDIAKYSAYVFFSESHGGWNRYNSSADARRIKAANPAVKVCMYWKPSTLNLRTLSPEQQDSLLDVTSLHPRNRVEQRSGDPFVRDSLSGEIGTDPGFLRNFALRDQDGKAIRPYNNNSIVYLDVRNSAQRDWVVDAVAALLKDINSPFDCVALDSLNLIGGGTPVGPNGENLCPDADPSFLDFATLVIRDKHKYSDRQSACRMRWFWQSRLGVEQFDSVVAAYNRAILDLVSELRRDIPDKEIFFNGVAEKVWRYNRNLAILFAPSDAGPHGALDEGFCVDYLRKPGKSETTEDVDRGLYGMRAYKTAASVRNDWDMMKRVAQAGKKLFLKTNLASEHGTGHFVQKMKNVHPQIASVPDQKSFCLAAFLIGAQSLEQHSSHWATFYKFGDRYRTSLELQYHDKTRQNGPPLRLLPATSKFDLGPAESDSYRSLGGGLFCRAYKRGTVYLYFGDSANTPVRIRHQGTPIDYSRWSPGPKDLHELKPYGSAVFDASDRAAGYDDCRT